jgi:hypothetical protein
LKSVLLSAALGMAASSAFAQPPTSLCDIPAYATTFNNRYDKELALRQRLGNLSRQTDVENRARLRRTLLASNQVSETEVDAKLTEIAAQPDVVELTRARDAAQKSAKSMGLAFGALEFVAGPDPVRLARAQCISSNIALVYVAQERAFSERIAALTRQRLLAFGQERGMVPPESLVQSLRPTTWACATPEGRAAAEEDVALQLDVLRTQQRQSESELDALLKTKGWDKQKRSQVFKDMMEKPEFTAIESEKKPVVAGLVALMKSGGDNAESTASEGPCTWPARFTPILQKIGELNAQQYQWMGRFLQQTE